MKEKTIAVDLGGTRVRVAISNRELTLAGRIEEKTDLSGGADGAIEQIVRLVRRSTQAAGVDLSQIGRLAIATPGPLNTRLGIVYTPPNLREWGDLPLRDRLEERLSVPVTIANDANVAGLGEYFYGAGRGTGTMVYLTVSTGIGGAVVVEGKLLEGASGTAGEIGHMTIDRHGPICACGNVGCLEMLASGTAIGRIFQQGLDAGEPSVACQWLQGRDATAADCARAAALEDAFAAAVFLDAAEALGTGVVNCVHIFNPDLVVLGGGVTRAGALLFDPVRRVVERYTMAVPLGAVRIVPAELGEDVGLVGAAALARAELAGERR